MTEVDGLFFLMPVHVFILKFPDVVWPTSYTTSLQQTNQISSANVIQCLPGSKLLQLEQPVMFLCIKCFQKSLASAGLVSFVESCKHNCLHVHVHNCKNN